MKFNIEMIYENLKLPNINLSSNHKTEFLIESVRLYSSSQNIQSNYLYIITAEELRKLSPSYIASFICIGSYIPLESEYNLSLIILEEEVDSGFILQSILEILEKFYLWKQNIYSLIFQNAPLQEVLDSCSTMLSNPVALFDNQQSLILKSGDISTNSMDMIWKHVLKTGESPSEAPSVFISEQLQSTPYPFYYNSDNEFKNINRLIVRIIYEQTYFGCLAMTDVLKSFTATEYSVLFYTAKILELSLANSDEFKSYRSETPWFLTQIFKGNILEPETLNYNISLLGIRKNEPYRLWIFTPLKNINLYHTGSYFKNIKQLFNSNFTYLYKNQVIVLCYNTSLNSQKDWCDKLKSLLDKQNMSSSCSMIYYTFNDIYSAFLQCKTLLDTFNSSVPNHFDFHRYFPILLRNSLESSFNTKTLLYPGIKDIILKNDEYGMELLNCLKIYIITGQNISISAKLLNIHRHTVLYRLDKIKEFLKVDFKTLDESSLVQIYVSCLILLEDKIG